MSRVLVVKALPSLHSYFCRFCGAVCDCLVLHKSPTTALVSGSKRFGYCCHDMEIIPKSCSDRRNYNKYSTIHSPLFDPDAPREFIILCSDRGNHTAIILQSYCNHPLCRITPCEDTQDAIHTGRENLIRVIFVCLFVCLFVAFFLWCSAEKIFGILFQEILPRQEVWYLSLRMYFVAIHLCLEPVSLSVCLCLSISL